MKLEKKVCLGHIAPQRPIDENLRSPCKYCKADESNKKCEYYKEMTIWYYNGR